MQISNLCHVQICQGRCNPPPYIGPINILELCCTQKRKTSSGCAPVSGKFCKKIFQNFCFSCYIRKIIQLITCSGLFLLLVRGKQLIHVHNFVQINILIRVHCSKGLGFTFTIRGWPFGVVTPQGTQMKTVLRDYKHKHFRIFLCHFKRAL